MTATLEPGTRFGDFTIVRLLREEGTAAVCEATNAAGTTVNLRVVSGDPETIAQAVHDADLVAQLGHPQVAKVLVTGSQDGVAFIASEVLPGESLAQLIARQGQVPLDRAVEIVLPLVVAVAAAHEHGIPRAELNPTRVLLPRNPDGAVVPRILDLGVPQPVVRPEETYLPPEHTLGRIALVPAGDQYVLAMLLYEAVTGRRPNPMRVEPPSQRAADLPVACEAALVRALDRKASARFPSVVAFGRALLPFAAEKVAATWDPQLVERAPAAPVAPMADLHTPTPTPVPRTALLPSPSGFPAAGAGLLGTRLDHGADEPAPALPRRKPTGARRVTSAPPRVSAAEAAGDHGGADELAVPVSERRPVTGRHSGRPRPSRRSLPWAILLGGLAIGAGAVGAFTLLKPQAAPVVQVPVEPRAPVAPPPAAEPAPPEDEDVPAPMPRQPLRRAKRAASK